MKLAPLGPCTESLQEDCVQSGFSRIQLTCDFQKKRKEKLLGVCNSCYVPVTQVSNVLVPVVGF